MKLSQKQEWLVARYLRAVAQELGDVPDAARARAVARLKARILRSLRELDVAPLPDPEVVAVLDALGSPADQARELLEQRPAARGLEPSVDDRVWLGVCAGLGERLGVAVGVVRLAAVLAGLLTGPVALVLYVALYLEMYLSSPVGEAPRINTLLVAKRAAAGVAAVVAMDVGTRVVLLLMEKAYLRVMLRDVLPDLGSWDWLRPDQAFMLLCALFVCTPFLVLSALPVANQWDETCKRLGQAGLAVYALILSVGIASRVAGTLLLVVRDLAP